MNDQHLEVEAKFPLSDASELTARIQAFQLQCLQPRSYERNLRFSDANGKLEAEHIVLRLRNTDGKYLLTYKGPSRNKNSVAIREEIETEVNDFAAMQMILERLGYHPFFIYEKERSIYKLDDTTLMLDHTPIGDFLEIEGPDEDAIRRSSEKLGLDWNTRTDESYQRLFRKWAKENAYTGRDMVFQK